MMEKIIEIKNQVIELILAQKILSAVIALTVVLLLSTIFISASQVDIKKPSKNLSLNLKPTASYPSVTSEPGKPITPEITTTDPKITNPATNPSSKPANVIVNKSPTPRPTLLIRPTAKPGLSPTLRPTSTSGASGNSSRTQPTSRPNPTSNPSSIIIPTPTPSLPQIIFIGPDGQPETYVPPVIPPVDINWARYTNQLEHYAIDYPSNWQIISTKYRGHDAIFIYAPGADPSDPDVQYISYGWSTYFYPPIASYVGSFTLDGVPGTIYTNGTLGSTYIAGVFNYANGYLILNNNVSDETFAYIFNHMVLSLDFNTP